MYMCLYDSWKYNNQIKAMAIVTDPMLDQCWASVADDGTTLSQHWVSVTKRMPSKIETWK